MGRKFNIKKYTKSKLFDLSFRYIRINNSKFTKKIKFFKFKNAKFY